MPSHENPPDVYSITSDSPSEVSSREPPRKKQKMAGSASVQQEGSAEAVSHSRPSLREKPQLNSVTNGLESESSSDPDYDSGDSPPRKNFKLKGYMPPVMRKSAVQLSRQTPAFLEDRGLVENRFPGQSPNTSRHTENVARVSLDKSPGTAAPKIPALPGHAEQKYPTTSQQPHKVNTGGLYSTVIQRSYQQPAVEEIGGRHRKSSAQRDFSHTKYYDPIIIDDTDDDEVAGEAEADPTPRAREISRSSSLKAQVLVSKQLPGSIQAKRGLRRNLMRSSTETKTQQLHRRVSRSGLFGLEPRPLRMYLLTNLCT